MMASLYQSSSTISAASAFLVSTEDRTFIAAPLRQTAEQKRRIAVGIDTQPDPAPFDAGLFAGEEVFECRHMVTLPAGVNGHVAERQPAFAHMAGKCDHDDDNVGGLSRLLDEGDGLAVFDVQKTQIRRLLKRR